MYTSLHYNIILYHIYDNIINMRRISTSSIYMNLFFNESIRCENEPYILKNFKLITKLNYIDVNLIIQQ